MENLFSFFGQELLAGVLGLVFGLGLSVLANRGFFPEYLQSPFILDSVLVCFTLDDLNMNVTGLIVLTVLGLTFGWAYMNTFLMENVTQFIECVSVLLTSTVFILLTASLSRETIMQIFSWPIVIFVIVMLFIVRPLSIWLSTIGTELTRPEKTLIGWIAPRGI